MAVELNKLFKMCGFMAEVPGIEIKKTSANIYQIIYDESQREKCYPFAEVYFNDSLTIFFENSVISDLVSAAQVDKIAVCSWKLRQKMRWYIGKPRELTQEILESDYDVMSFTKNTRNHTMFAAAETNHKGFIKTFRKICDSIGVKFKGEVRIPIYQNHFSAKTEIYQDYVKEYLNPAMDVMKNDPEINKLIMADSNYSSLTSTTPEQLERLRTKIGIGYFPMAPFLLERLFSVYVQNKNVNVTWL